jgi:type I restriction enzyme M protein
MEHLIYHMSPQGRVGMVLANGSLSSQTGGEGEIRKNILEDDLVEGIVALPSQLFYSTQIPVCLWFLSRRKEQSGKVLFIDARNMGEMVSRRNRELSEDDINRIAGLFNDYRRGELKDEKGLCAVKSLDDIREQDYILTPGRYVGIAEQEDDGEPFEEKMNRLTTELSGLFTESHRLEKEIQKQLASIGFKLNF